MAYLSLYRKYRSQSFEDVSGQEHVVRTLQNAVRQARVAHAYLFCGPRGTGKTTSARLLAKAMNCVHGPTPTPCNECDACVQITEGRFLDVKEVDAATNRGIDEIRDLRDQVAYTPAGGRYKVYIIDEVHQITSDAFNALLKTLEEPPPHVVFVLATTESHKIPATITSRCQKFDFHRATLDQLRDRVRLVAEAEGFQLEESALTLIAREANGGWRDALSLLEQVLAFATGKVTARDVTTVLGTVESDVLFELCGAVAAHNGRAVYGGLEVLVAEGKDPRQLLRELTGHFRLALLADAGCDLPADAPEADRFRRMARDFGSRKLLKAVELLAQAEKDARWSEQPRLLLEIALGELLQAPAAEAVERPQPRPRPAAEPVSPPERRAAPPSPPAPQPAAPAPVSRPAPQPAAPAPASRPVVGDARAGRDSDLDLSAFDEPPAPPSPERQVSESSAAPPAGRDIELLQRKWRLIGEELKRDRKKTIESCLVNTMPHRFEGDVLVVRFPNRMMTDLFTRRGKEFSEPLQAAILRITGVECRVRAEQSPAAPAAARPAAPPRPAEPPAPAAAGTPAARVGEVPTGGYQPELISTQPGRSELIHEILEVFDGRIIDPAELEER